MATLRTAEALREHLDALGVELDFDEVVETGPAAPLAQPLQAGGLRIGNRFAILPMEGWDGTPEGLPTELTERRWERFGESGAKLIWGGEAVAVRHDGRANPNQLMIDERTVEHITRLRRLLVSSHERDHGDSADLVVGLQLTHSGRYARPHPGGAPDPRIAYRHPILDQRVGVSDDSPVLSDDDMDQLVEDFVTAAVLAEQAGFTFVDVKHCHGYLGHELLSAVDREGRYGGSLENRTRFLRGVVQGIRTAAPSLQVGVRVSVFDFVPFGQADDGTGKPETVGDYRYAFGGDGSGLAMDLAEPRALLDHLAELGVDLLCTSAGSPYYNPHIQRPALFPPSDGYEPPEDPLVGVARQIAATAQLKRHRPDLVVVGSAYSYLQEWLPNVAQHVVRSGGADLVGIGRMVLSYPTCVADTLAGRAWQRKLVCRTFSDCTTAPRNGMVSGCYPLDEFYKERPEAERLRALKKALAATAS